MPKIDLDAIRPDEGPDDGPDGDDALGAFRRWAVGDAAGLSQFGVAIEELAPGSRSSDRHWHAHQDEIVMVLDGQAVLVEDGGETPLGAGEIAAWKAGVPNAHHLVNRSDRPMRFLVVGSRTAADVVTYPDLGRWTERREDGTWTVFNADGSVRREGRENSEGPF